jgi:hypothetical protein
MVIVEKLVELLAGETEVLGENLPQRQFVHHKSHMTRPGFEPGKPATNRLSYGAAEALPSSKTSTNFVQTTLPQMAEVFVRSTRNQYIWRDRARKNKFSCIHHRLFKHWSWGR